MNGTNVANKHAETL